MTIKILVTGFGAFPGAPSNPTTAILKRLERDHRRSLALAGVELRTAVLPVVYEGAEARAAAALGDADAVLHLGLAGRRRALTLEARARNRLSALHPDAAGRRAGRSRVAPEGPAQQACRAPAPQMIAAARRAGAATLRSIDAGDYLCNQTLFATLSGPVRQAAFLHVPRPANPRARAGRSRRLPLEAMARATAAMIRELARAAHRSAASGDVRVRSL